MVVRAARDHVSSWLPPSSATSPVLESYINANFQAYTDYIATLKSTPRPSPAMEFNMSVRGSVQLFTRLSYRRPSYAPSSPHSPASSSPASPEEEPDTLDLASISNGVLNRLKTTAFPLQLNMTWPERSHSPTPPSSPVNDRPYILGRSKTAPAVLRRRKYKGESDQEYDEMPKERREAAQKRVNQMREYLGIKTMNDSVHERKDSVMSESLEDEILSPLSACESFHPTHTETQEGLRRCSTLEAPIDALPPRMKASLLSRSNSLPAAIPTFLPKGIR